jgi:hypothetical protein
LVVPLRETEGTNLFKSEILETLEFSNVDAPTTAADTVTSDNFSVRFCAVITISPISDSALAPGAVCAKTNPTGVSETTVVKVNATRRMILEIAMPIPLL